MAKIFKRYIVFILMFVAPVIMSFCRKIDFLSSLQFIRYVDDAVLILILPLAVRGIRYLLGRNFGVLLLLFYVMFLLIGFVSGVLNSVPILQIVFQFLLELKYPLMLCSVFGVVEKRWFFKQYLSWSKLILLASFPLVLWQVIDPSSYHIFFSSGADKALFRLPTGALLERAAGIFWFPGELAMYSGIAFIYFLFHYLKTRLLVHKFWAIFAFILLMFSLSRLEIMATVFGVLLSIIISQSNQKKKILLVQYLLLIIPMLIILIPFFRQSYEHLELYNIENSHAARVVFYNYSIDIAKMFFPLGAGFGTYGGQAAVIFDSDLYHLFGFDFFWWYRMKMYLTDTYWPHILGESGVFGFLFLVCSFYVLWRMATDSLKVAKRFRTFNEEFFEISRSGIAACCLIFLNSLAAPIFYSVSIMPCLILVAMAVEYREYFCLNNQ